MYSGKKTQIRKSFKFDFDWYDIITFPQSGIVDESAISIIAEIDLPPNI
jgi:hypothetical protein